jgi:hypothetical protein
MVLTIEDSDGMAFFYEQSVSVTPETDINAHVYFLTV